MSEEKEIQKLYCVRHVWVERYSDLASNIINAEIPADYIPERRCHICGVLNE